MAGQQLPFRLTSPAPLQGLGRAGDGRFESLRAPPPSEVVARGAPDSMVRDAVRANRAPEHMPPAGQPQAANGAFRASLPYPDPPQPPTAQVYVSGLPVRFRST